jgi:hypothetical protein
VEELDTQIREMERALKDHREAYLAKKKERDDLTKAPLWLATIQRGLRRMSTPRSDDVSTETEGLEEDDDDDGGGEDDDGMQQPAQQQQQQQPPPPPPQQQQQQPPPQPPPQRTRQYFAVDMLAEVRHPQDDEWQPCKIRGITAAAAASAADAASDSYGDGGPPRNFVVALLNREVLDVVPEECLRPLSARTAMLIDLSAFDDDHDDSGRRRAGSDSSGSSSGSGSSRSSSRRHSDSTESSDGGRRVPTVPVPSQPPPQPKPQLQPQPQPSRAREASPFEAFYAQLPSVRAVIRSIGTPRSGRDDDDDDGGGGGGDQDDSDMGAALERVHASLDRINSDVRATAPLPSYDDGENRADRLERLQEEMDLSRRDVRLNVSSAAKSLHGLRSHGGGSGSGSDEI